MIQCSFITISFSTNCYTYILQYHMHMPIQQTRTHDDTLHQCMSTPEPTTWSIPCHDVVACMSQWPWELWQLEHNLLKGPPMLERSKGRGQTNLDHLSLRPMTNNPWPEKPSLLQNDRQQNHKTQTCVWKDLHSEGVWRPAVKAWWKLHSWPPLPPPPPLDIQDNHQDGLLEHPQTVWSRDGSTDGSRDEQLHGIPARSVWDQMDTVRSSETVIKKNNSVLRPWERGWPHTERVALMLTNEAQRALISWEVLSSRIITIKFRTKMKNIHIMQCYAPTNDAEEERKEDFLQQAPECAGQVKMQRERYENTDGELQCKDRHQ